jgi:hypothetical protein
MILRATTGFTCPACCLVTHSARGATSARASGPAHMLLLFPAPVYQLVHSRFHARRARLMDSHGSKKPSFRVSRNVGLFDQSPGYGRRFNPLGSSAGFRELMRTTIQYHGRNTILCVWQTKEYRFLGGICVFCVCVDATLTHIHFFDKSWQLEDVVAVK